MEPSPLAARLLPHETTVRSHLPRPRAVLGSVQVWGLGDGVAPGRSKDDLALLGGVWGELLVSSPEPLAALDLTFGRDATSHLEVWGGTLQEDVLRPDGSIRFRIGLGDASRRHAVWWSDEEEHFYGVRLRLPGALPRLYGCRLGARFETGRGG